MTKNATIPRPEFVPSTLELYHELFTIQPLGQAMEDLDRVHKFVMLTEDEHFSNIDKQTWWQTYKQLKITLTSFEKMETPEHIFEVEIEL